MPDATPRCGVIRINECQPNQIVAQLTRHFPSLKGVCVAVLGLSFRPGTDDVRESPALPIIEDLLAHEADVGAYDPVAGNVARGMLSGRSVRVCGRLEEAVDGAQAVVLVTRWEELKRLPELLCNRVPPPLVFDGRHMLDKRIFERYEGIGLAL